MLLLLLQGVVSSTFYIAQIIVQSHFELVNSVLALEATEPVSEPVTQMAVEMINNHLISVQSKRDECKSYNLFHVKTTINIFWNDAEMLLKSFWNSHLKIINGLDPYSRIELVDQKV